MVSFVIQLLSLSQGFLIDPFQRKSDRISFWILERFAEIDSFIERNVIGDIILTPDQAESIYTAAASEGLHRVKRKFIGSKVRRWDPKRPIIYSFDGSHSKW